MTGKFSLERLRSSRGRPDRPAISRRGRLFPGLKSAPPTSPQCARRPPGSRSAWLTAAPRNSPASAMGRRRHGRSATRLPGTVRPRSRMARTTPRDMIRLEQMIAVGASLCSRRRRADAVAVLLRHGDGMAADGRAAKGQTMRRRAGRRARDGWRRSGCRLR